MTNRCMPESRTLSSANSGLDAHASGSITWNAFCIHLRASGALFPSVINLPAWWQVLKMDLPISSSLDASNSRCVQRCEVRNFEAGPMQLTSRVESSARCLSCSVQKTRHLAILINLRPRVRTCDLVSHEHRKTLVLFSPGLCQQISL